MRGVNHPLSKEEVFLLVSSIMLPYGTHRGLLLQGKNLASTPEEVLMLKLAATVVPSRVSYSDIAIN